MLEPVRMATTVDEFGSKIAEGKFAVILKARISVGNKKQDAAAKVLRSMASIYVLNSILTLSYV